MSPQPGMMAQPLSHDPAGRIIRSAALHMMSPYADTRSWVQQGLLDYIATQIIYWPFARDAARYDVLASWWAEVVKPTMYPAVYRRGAVQRWVKPSKK